jgi:hypothetical protein
MSRGPSSLPSSLPPSLPPSLLTPTTSVLSPTVYSVSGLTPRSKRAAVRTINRGPTRRPRTNVSPCTKEGGRENAFV